MPVYKNQKRNSWYCSFYYRDWNGTHKRKKKEGFPTKKAAKEYEAAFLASKSGNCNMPFRCMAELYLEDCRSRCKSTSYYEKEVLIRSKIIPFFGDMSVSEIRPSSIRLWQNELLTARKSNGCPYSPTYLKSISVQLSAIFNYAVKYYGLSQNPALLCGSMGQKKASPMGFWTLEEFNLFLASLRGNHLSQTIFQILFWTGIRSGELLALSVESFDFSKRLLHIDKNYCRLHKEDVFLTPKTPKSKRAIALPAFLCHQIQEYISSLNPDTSKERLFPVSKYYLTSQLKQGCMNSGVRQIRLHDLRHSHASLLIELGASPLLISERLGHEKVETTLQIYSHLYPNKQAAVADLLDNVHNSTLSVL